MAERWRCSFPAALDRQPAFEPFVELATRLVGPEAMSLLSTYFVCGDLDELTALFESAGLAVTASRTVAGTYAAPSVDAAVRTEVESTPLIERIDEATYAAAARGDRRDLAPVRRCRRQPGGTVRERAGCRVTRR